MRPFLDTNILVYAAVPAGRKSLVADRLLRAGARLSVQVLNEFVSVCRRKLKMDWEPIRRQLAAFEVLCPNPVPTTHVIHERALDLAERTGFQFFDCLILAVALHSGGSLLHSEDMQHGRVIDGRLTISNPFL
jgi:predicted nucleic acid-binding protein